MTTDNMIGRIVLGRYRIIKPLARGGMGMVYLGRTEGAAGFSRPVVIKRILPHLVADPEMPRMFVREARILSNLHHPGIVGVIDFGEEESAYVMVLEYVHGYDVGIWRKYLGKRQRQLPPDMAIHVIIRVLDALHYAHTLKRPDGAVLNIVHRDVSPGNILLDVEGHVRLLDFGIARVANEINEYRTQDATFKGKLAYAPPELLQGSEPSPQSDLYSSAVSLYQLLSGENPFRGGTSAETLNRVINHTPMPVAERIANTPRALDSVLARALRKDPRERYRSAADFADALREVRSAPENEVSAAMAEAVQYDFLGEMPSIMNIEALRIRDAAWREAEEQSQSSMPLRSSPSSPAPDVPPPGFPGLPSVRPTTSESPTIVGSSQDATIARSRGTGSNGLLRFAVGALALALAGAAGALMMAPQDPVGAPRYLVVEKSPDQGVPQPAAVGGLATSSTSASPAETAPPPTAAPPTAERASPPQPIQKSSSAKKPDPARLTRTFSSRQGAVQACFKRNPKQAAKTPSLEIMFRVNTSGAVQSATIGGGANGTALGSCIQRIAANTRFGPLTESVAFRIPIRARSSK